MINSYLITEVARLEHEERVRSLAPILDDGGPLTIHQPGWLSRQIRRLFQALASGLASLRRSVKEQRAISIQRDLTRAKE